MYELALFAGAGGGVLGGKLLGWRTRCAVEINPYCQKVLLARQRDGHLPRFPIWDDVSTFNGRPWRGAIDVISGGFPCQDISTAGKGRGVSGERSGLVFEMLRIVDEVRPKFVFAENSPLLRTRGLGAILTELDRLGYDARWCVLGAWHVGAPHKRNRMWILAADTSCVNWRIQQVSKKSEEKAQSLVNGEKEQMANTNRTQCKGMQRPGGIDTEHAHFGHPSWWDVEPRVGRVANGVAHRMDRLEALGNGQVPYVAALAWKILSDGLWHN